MSSISSFNAISAVVSDSKFFVCNPAFAAYAAAVNTNGIKTLLANDLITFFINNNPFFNN